MMEMVRLGNGPYKMQIGSLDICPISYIHQIIDIWVDFHTMPPSPKPALLNMVDEAMY